MTYQLAFAPDAVEELLALDSPLDRRKIVATIQCLTVDPVGSGIGEVIDGRGRTNRVAMIGRYAFVFWIDHAMGRMRILAIRAMND
jgi:hypothetical protein